MGSRTRESRIDQFAGLSDRQIPVNMTRIESPDLRNCEFSGRALERRNGFVRAHASMFRDSSARLDGVSDYIKIPNRQATYQVSNRLFLSIDVVIRQINMGTTPAETWIVSRGYGTGANRFLSISYDPSINTNNGGWRLRARDTSGGGADRNETIDDGDGGNIPTDLFRHIEVAWTGSGDNYTFTVYNSAGSVIDSAQTFSMPAWLADSAIGSATGWFLGVDQSSAGVPVANTYASATLAEFRLWDATSVPSYFSEAAASRVDRELDNGPDSAEYTRLVGYWKLNDGNGSSVSDSSTVGNIGIIGNEGPEWTTDLALSVRPSALEFFGEAGSVLWKVGTGGQEIWNDSSNGGAVDTRRWAFTCLFVPRMAEGETTVRDQTIFWSGASATVPEPFGLTVVSNKIRAHYHDGASTKTLDSAAALSTYVNTRVRIQVVHWDPSGVGVSDVMQLHIDPEGVANAFTTVDTAGGNPSAISSYWSIGRKHSNANFQAPHTFHDSSARGVISDIMIYRAADSPPGGTQGYIQWTGSSTAPATLTGIYPSITVDANMPLDDGAGDTPRTGGSLSASQSAWILEGEESGVRWDIGIVDPYDPVEIDGVFDYRRGTADGGTMRSLLVVVGTTLYEVTNLQNASLGTATVTAVAGNIHKGGKCTFTQLSNTVYIGRPNGKRPRKYSNDEGGNTLLDWVGIRAPVLEPYPVAANTSSGALAAGTYNIYFTYRNSDTGVESNPSPGTAITIGGSNDGITSLQISASSDPQVNQRRVWMTAAGAGLALGVAPIYLVATIGDNVTTNYTIDIDSVSATSTSITDMLANTPPPTSGVVKVFKERLFAAGDPRFPNRVHFSSVLDPDAFGGTDYISTDQDTGDKIVAMARLSNRLVVFGRDGRVFVTASSNSDAPFFTAVSSRDSGAIGPIGVTEHEMALVYLGERDFWLWDGGSAANLTSPNGQTRPSIQTLVRTGLSASRRSSASVVAHRSRGKFLFAVSSSGATRNDTILDFDYEQGVWSRHDIDADILIEAEDGNDDPWVYAGIRGFICKLDTGTYDGPSVLNAGTATGGTTATLVDSSPSPSWAANAFKGMRVYWYDSSANVMRNARIRKNTTTTLSFYAVTTAPASGDAYMIGGIPFYADFIHDFGNPMMLKKLQWLRVAGESDDDGNVLRVTIRPDFPGRDTVASPWNSASSTEYYRTWASSKKFVLLPVGKLGRSFRVRMAESGFANSTSADSVPTTEGKISIYEMSLEAEELQAK